MTRTTIPRCSLSWWERLPTWRRLLLCPWGFHDWYEGWDVRDGLPVLICMDCEEVP